MQKTKRREFLKASVGAAAALATPRLIEKCAGKNASQAPSENKNAKVTAIRGDNLDSMTRDAIDALGGIQTVVNKGETVFIKPNFVNFPWAQYNSCFHKGECTKPEIIIASTNIMAADATSARIMSHDTNTIKHLAMGFDMGLGEIREPSIDILGEKLDNLRVKWKSARLKG